MKKTTILILFMLIAALGFSQENQDQVILKDGTIYQGAIAELIPDSLVTIKLVDGRVKTIPFSEIDLVKNKGKKMITPREKKYYIKGNLGILLGNSQYNLEKSFLFETTGGYKHKKWSAGLGTGVNVLYQIMYLPTLAEIEYTFSTSKTSPYLNIQGGRAFNLAYNDNNNYPYYYNGYKNGNFIGGNIGLKHYISDQLGLIFEAGYRYYKLHKKGNESFYNSNSIESLVYYPVQYKANLHRFSMKIGLVF